MAKILPIGEVLFEYDGNKQTKFCFQDDIKGRIYEGG